MPLVRQCLQFLLWLSGLVLGLVARARGDRRRGKIAIIICLVELGLLVLAITAFCILYAIEGRPI